MNRTRGGLFAGPAVCAALAVLSSSAAALPAEVSALSPGFYDLDFRVETGKWRHDRENPGPTLRGRDRAGYSSSHVGKKLALHWDSGPELRGRTPLFLTRVDIDFTQTLRGAISSLYPKDSCVYRVVKEHELGHLRAFVRIFRDGESELKRDLERLRLPTAERPHWTGDASAAKDEIGARVAQAVKDAAETIKLKMMLDRAKRDMPKEYAKDYAKCPSAEWRAPPHPPVDE